MKIGTIGSGMIVEKFIKTTIENEGAECIGVYSRTEENARRLADAFQISSVYTNYDQMLGNNDIDTIYIGSPNSLHYEQCKAALNKGKNVICEKPFTSNLAELRELVALAKEKGLFLFEAITTLHLPNMAYLKEQLGNIGRIRMVRTNFTQYSLRYDQLKNGEVTNIFNSVFSGGALMDLNIYNIHFTMSLFGEPKNVTYYANKHENGIDTSGVAVLLYDDFIAECCGAKDCHGNSSCSIYGEKGQIHVNGPASRVLSVCTEIEGDKKEYDIQTNDNALYYELSEFVKCRERADYDTCYTLLDHSLSVMKVLDQARKSAGIVFPADIK